MTRILWAAIAAAVVTWSCGSDDDSTGPTDPPQLETSYAYFANAAEIRLQTSPDYLALRFRADQSEEAIQDFLSSHEMSEAMRTDASNFSLHVVQVADAFVAAETLALDPRVEYVGPVFASRCNGEIRFMCVGNELIVRGNVQQRAVKQMLAGAGATVAMHNSSDPDRYIYALPWGRAGALFDLGLGLARQAQIQYAEPNFMTQICWGAAAEATK